MNFGGQISNSLPLPNNLPKLNDIRTNDANLCTVRYYMSCMYIENILNCAQACIEIVNEKYSMMQSEGNSFLAEMSSYTALTWHIGINLAFYTQNMKSKNFGDF